MRIGCLGLLAMACGEPSVVINEVLSHNQAAWPDPDTADAECPDFDDYVELWNQSNEVVRLDRLSLSDGGTPWRMPEGELAPGAYTLVLADGQPEQGPLHAPFGVSRHGETLTLRQGVGKRPDQVDVPPLEPDVAWARFGDGGAQWRVASPTPGTANEPPPDDPCFTLPPGTFDDHTVPCISTRAGFEALATGRAGVSVVKFDLLSFQDPAQRHAIFLDNRFYSFHDEWYIFRLLNGQPIEGETTIESYAGSFATWNEIVAWAESVDVSSFYPQHVLWMAPSGRLTSFRYYSLALDAPRQIGAGTLVHAAPTADRPEVWAFDLEYADDISYENLVAYFDTLEAHLDPSSTASLRWLVRSPEQEALAQEMEAEGRPYADRVMRYGELSTAGTVDVYHEGTVAGRVRVIGPEASIGEALPTDVLVLADVPDELPACAAIITSVPQTPLSHIALLARSRGIPNLHVSGLATDPQWDAWSRARVNVAIRVTAPDRFDVAPLTSAEYRQWLRLQDRAPPELTPVNGAALPYVVDPEQLAAADVIPQRSPLGGKTAGYSVLALAGAPRPDAALGITVRAYQAQLAAMDLEDAVLGHAAFRSSGDPRTRWLILEGTEGYDAHFRRAGDRTHREEVLDDHAVGTVIGDLIRQGGVQGAFARAPVVPEVAEALRAALEARFAHYAPDQPLRFRSSSNVEDLEGFVGAGLYQSASGWLETTDSVERALMEVWGSYWSFEALEERHAAGIDHRLGDMGVLVHAAFQDELELANGVVVATLEPDGWITLDVNVQEGALSVTNPPTGCAVQPEILQIEVAPDGDALITRVQPSSHVAGGEVLTDPELLDLGAAVADVLHAWLAIENASVPPTNARSVMTLDLEFRKVGGAWPLRADDQQSIDRVLLKQARSLEPSLARIPDDVREEPFPRDVLARADRVDLVTCRTASTTLEVVEAYTDRRIRPDLGHTHTPFVASVAVDGTVANHTAWAARDLVRPSQDPWQIDIVLDEEAPWVAVAVDGFALTIDDGAGPVREPLLEPCAVSTTWAAPDAFLEDLIDAG